MPEVTALGTEPKRLSVVLTNKLYFKIIDNRY